MIRIPPDLSTGLLILLYSVAGILIFLAGKALGFLAASEKSKLQDKNGEVLKLRQNNKILIMENNRLTKSNKKYLDTLSGVRYLLRKGDDK